MDPIPVTSLSLEPSTGSGFRGGDPSFIQQAYSKYPYVPGLFQILKDTAVDRTNKSLPSRS